MTYEWFLAVATFAVVTCYTPGPNNTMLMASGLNHGFARTLPHLLGVSFGFTAMLIAVALGIAGVFQALPALYGALKAVSVAYLVWLAWRIAIAEPSLSGERTGRPMTFVEGALFQWVNPKAWIMAVGASATYIVAGKATASVFVIATLFCIVGLSSSATWAAGGTALRRLIANRRAIRAINVVLALLLLASLWPIVKDLWTGT